MISISIDLHIYGLSPPNGLAHISIFTKATNTHGYYITTTDGSVRIEGNIPKTCSAHQNIFHVLKAVLEDASNELDALGKDYIPRGGYD